MSRYDQIGRTYITGRRTEPRIAAQIWAALGEARTVLNVGAGTGSYEPADRELTAVEPSAVMRAQRAPDAAPCVEASAEALPFADKAFDAAMATLTMHHWADIVAGGAELQRVADRVVVFGWDPQGPRMWLGPEYFPGLFDLDVAAHPTLQQQIDAIGATRVEVIPVPHDCVDGFMACYWRRPEAYLDPEVRACISTFALRPEVETAAGLKRLEEDLASGVWAERHADLLELDELDIGYRLLVKD